MNTDTRINVVTEGPTEETFVNAVLVDHLQQFRIFDVRAHSITTGYTKGRPHRGGFLRYDHLERDILNWLRQDPRAVVTTMVDLYGLPSDFPNKEMFIHEPNPFTKVEKAETEFANKINNPRFVPYIQLHEFEGILFSDVQQIHQSMIPSGSSHADLRKLQTIRAEFHTPEEINDNPQTAPSKRILGIYPSFQKPTDGIIIAKRIGINAIRRECSHFNKWLLQLESLSQ
jgi:hypothetical protein